MKMEDAARPVQEEALASLELAEERVKQSEERCQRLLKEATEGTYVYVNTCVPC